MRYLTDTLNTLLAGMGLQLQPWMAPAFAVVLALMALPAFHANFKTKQARKLIQRANLVAGEQRRELQRAALSMVARSPVGLTVLASEAHAKGMGPFSREVLQVLNDTGKRRNEFRKLHRKIHNQVPRTAEGEAAAIEKLLEAGLEERAGQRLEQALARWPESEALAEVRDGALEEGAHRAMS